MMMTRKDYYGYIKYNLKMYKIYAAFGIYFLWHELFWKLTDDFWVQL